MTTDFAKAPKTMEGTYTLGDMSFAGAEKSYPPTGPEGEVIATQIGEAPRSAESMWE